MATEASMAPVVLKVQQLPHWPWSFTGVSTAGVRLRQSTDAGAALAPAPTSEANEAAAGGAGSSLRAHPL